MSCKSDLEQRSVISHLKSTALILASTAISLHVSEAYSQENPTEPLLQEMIMAEVPSWWQIESLTIVATSDLGDAILPKRAIRFEAEASPTDTLYVELERLGPFSLVVPALESDDKRTLYGVATVEYNAGQWFGEVMIENPVEGLGGPDSSFDIPTLVAGSARAIETLATINNKYTEEMNSRFIAEQESLRAAHGKEVAAIINAHKERLLEMADKAQALENDNARQLAEVGEDHRGMLDDLSKAHELSLVELQSAHDDLILRLEAARDEKIAEIERAADHEIGKARAEADARVAELTDVLKETEAERLLKDQILDEQERLLASSSLLEEAAKKASERRIEIADDLAGEWTGRVDCSTSFLPWYSFTATYAFEGAGSLAGQFTVTAEATSRFADQVGQPMASTMTLMSQVGEPVVLSLSTQGQIRNGLLSITVAQQPDGRFLGTAGEEGQCEVLISR